MLDPEVFPASYPAAGGLSPRALRELLAQVVRVADVVGAEITAAAPGYGEVAADAIAPLLE